MKRFMLLIVAMLLAAAQLLAQPMRDAVVANPDLARGVYSHYPAEVAAPAPAPKGYKPFYISHYGRHGSRYILRDYKFDNALAFLRRAASQNGLTAHGADLLARMERAAQLCGGRAGDLTPLGREQHRRIAARMYENHSDLFRRNPRVSAFSSVSPRVLVSMNCFTGELLRHNRNLDITWDTGNVCMRFINPFHDFFNQERNDAMMECRHPSPFWEEELRAFRREAVDNSRVAASLFTPEFLAAEPADGLDDFFGLLFKNVTCMPGTPVEERFDDIFTPEELYAHWRVVNYMFYMEKGPSGVGGGRLARAADPLVRDIVERAAAAVECGEPAVDLRFGHDGVIMGLLTAMGIEPWCVKASSPGEVELSWHDYDIPMASNLQWIFYRNRAGEVLVRMMHNERDICLPAAIRPEQEPYYRWEDVRAYYEAYLASADKQ